MKILIISGAGFLAGSNLYTRFVRRLSEKVNFTSDSDYPEVILHSFPFSDIDEEGNLGEKIELDLNKIINIHRDVDKTIIGCNTMYLLADRLLSVKGLLNLPELTIRKLEASDVTNKKALVLCSSFAAKHNLFSSPYVVYPSRKMQSICNSWIDKNIHRKSEPSKEEMNFLLHEIMEKNITHLIIGCTELNELNWKPINIICSILDTTEVAMDNIINEILKEKVNYEAVQ